VRRPTRPWTGPPSRSPCPSLPSHLTSPSNTCHTALLSYDIAITAGDHWSGQSSGQRAATGCLVQSLTFSAAAPGRISARGCRWSAPPWPWRRCTRPRSSWPRGSTGRTLREGGLVLSQPLTVGRAGGAGSPVLPGDGGVAAALGGRPTVGLLLGRVARADTLPARKGLDL
jgi:hypothetical protein